MKNATILLTTLLVLCLFSQPLLPSTLFGEAYLDPGSAFNVVRVSDPTYCLPAMVKPGSFFNISLTYTGSHAEVTSIKLYGLGKEYEIAGWSAVTAGAGTLIVNVVTPLGVEAGLYTIVAEVKVDGSSYKVVSPRSLWVVLEYPTSLKVMHLSDVHMGISMDNWWAADRYERYVAVANALNPDVIFITGDIADVGSDVNLYKDFMRATNKILQPTFCVPGNHDWSQVGSLSSFNRLYGTYVGPQYWVRELGYFVLVGLDTGSGGVLDTAQLLWLNNTLNTYEGVDKKVLILMHHPLFTGFGSLTGNSSDYRSLLGPMYSSWEGDLDKALTFLRIVEQHKNVIAVFSGHTHIDSTRLYLNRVWFMTVTTADGGTSHYRGYRLYDVRSDGTVEPINYGGTTYAENPSYPTDDLNIRVKTDKDLTMYANLVETNTLLPFTTDNFPLYFFVNKSYDLTQYRLYARYNTSPIHYEYTEYGNLWLVKSSTKLSPNTKLYLVLSTYADVTPPSAEIQYYTPLKPVSSKSTVTVYISASDTGWGIDSVKLLYKKPTDTKWFEAPVQEALGTYIAQIPPLATNQVVIKAVVTDIAGYTTETPEKVIDYVAATPTTAPTVTSITTPTTTTTLPSTTTTPVTTPTTPKPTTPTTPATTPTTPKPTTPTATTPATTPTTPKPTTPTTTPTTTTPVTTPKPTTPATTPTTTPTTTLTPPAPQPLLSLEVILGVLVVAVVVVIAVVFARRK